MGIADRPGCEPDPKLYMRIDMVLEEIKVELVKSMTKHAAMHSPHEGSSVIREEFEELWEHVMADTGRTREARKEALQVAAMGVRYALDLCSAAVEGVGDEETGHGGVSREERDLRGPAVTLKHDDHFNHDHGC
jgi:hypothetical protein